MTEPEEFEITKEDLENRFRLFTLYAETFVRLYELVKLARVMKDNRGEKRARETLVRLFGETVVDFRAFSEFFQANREFLIAEKALEPVVTPYRAAASELVRITMELEDYLVLSSDFLSDKK